MPAPRPACPRAELHTPIPLGQQVEEWAREMNRTHLQVRCPGCGLYACWTPRVLLPALACARCQRTDGIDWAELHFGLVPSGLLVPLCPDHWLDGEDFPAALLTCAVEELPSAVADVHRYLSTACHHGEHISCRNRCKSCRSCCICPCHLQAGSQPAAGSRVDQARALELREHGKVLPPGRWTETS